MIVVYAPACSVGSYNIKFSCLTAFEFPILIHILGSSEEDVINVVLLQVWSVKSFKQSKGPKIWLDVVLSYLFSTNSLSSFDHTGAAEQDLNTTLMYYDFINYNSELKLIQCVKREVKG